MEVKLLPVGMMGTNCYLLADESKKVCAVIDPGEDARRISGIVESAGYTPVAVFLTHGHYDHTGAVSKLQKKWPDVPFYMNRRDVFDSDLRMQQLCPYIPGLKDYDEGDAIAVGDLTVTVMSTPGHSEGSVTLRCGDVLFCGDTLFAGSMGRTDFPGGSMKKIMASLKRLGSLEGDLQVCPGHMETSTLDRERRTNPYMIQAMRMG